MFFDENLTGTKAFQEQLDQHEELFASWSDPAPGLQDRVFPKLKGVLLGVLGWLQSIAHSGANLPTGESA